MPRRGLGKCYPAGPLPGELRALPCRLSNREVCLQRYGRACWLVLRRVDLGKKHIQCNTRCLFSGSCQRREGRAAEVRAEDVIATDHAEVRGNIYALVAKSLQHADSDKIAKADTCGH